jgi:hypothetical protein
MQTVARPHLDALDDGATLANDSGFLVTQIDHSFPTLLDRRVSDGSLLLLFLFRDFYPGLLLWGWLGGGFLALLLLLALRLRRWRWLGRDHHLLLRVT